MFGYLTASKTRDVLTDCDCSIKMRTNPNSFTAEDTIMGDVIVSPHTKIDFRSLFIRFEGLATARFQTKMDNRMTNHLKTDRFLPDENLPDDGSLCVYFIGKRPDPKSPPTDKVSLQKGTHTFPFEIKLSGQSFPATFQSSFGRIQYKLILHATTFRDTYWHDTTPAERVLKTTGYLNLLTDPTLTSPQLITRKKEKSFFSRRPILELNLHLDKRGFLPGDQMSCKMILTNPGCEEITKMELCLVQKVIYFDNKVSKTTVAKLDEQENSCETCDGEIQWELNITVPANLMPSFTRDKKAVDIFYLLEFIVRDNKGKVALKGDTTIVIGTEAKNVDLLSADTAGSGGGTVVRRTSGDSSLALPPAYSNVSSRRPSMETLAPAYDAVVGDDNWDDERSTTPQSRFSRPRSSSFRM